MANFRTYRQHDAISDSSADFPNSKLRAKRPWSDDSNDDDQDTLMSGDDSFSSGCSISEMRSLKRLRIQDNQPQQHPFPSQKLHHSRCPPPSLQSFSVSINGNETLVGSPAMKTGRSSSHPNKNTLTSQNPWSESSRGETACSRGKEETISSHIVSVKDDALGFRCGNPQTTKKMQESNEYRGFNRVLGNLHMSRRNHRAVVNPINRQDGHTHNLNSSLRSNINSGGHEFNTRNTSIMQQAQARYHNQQEKNTRQEKNTPKWRRRINLQSNSQLY